MLLRGCLLFNIQLKLGQELHSTPVWHLLHFLIFIVLSIYKIHRLFHLGTVLNNEVLNLFGSEFFIKRVFVEISLKPPNILLRLKFVPQNDILCFDIRRLLPLAVDQELAETSL